MESTQAVEALIADAKHIAKIRTPGKRHAEVRQWLGRLEVVVEREPRLKSLALRMQSESYLEDVALLDSWVRQEPARDHSGAVPGVDASARQSRAQTQTDTAKITVFLSHKLEDEATALAVRDILLRYAGDRLEVHCSEDMAKGENWYDWICSRLRQCDVLLLLFTDVTKSWDWCLYEAGLFQQWGEEHKRRVICLHNDGVKPPSPLGMFQSVPGSIQRVAEFLTQFYTTTSLVQRGAALNPRLGQQPEEIRRAATEIAQLVSRKPVETHYFSDYLFLHVKDVDALRTDGIPLDSEVVASKSCLALFNKGDLKWQWSDILDELESSEDRRWIDELTANMVAASDMQLINPIRATLKPPRDDRYFHLVLYRVDTIGDGSQWFKMLLTAARPPLGDLAPPALSLTMDALSIAARIRYEIVDNYTKLLRAMSASADVTELVPQLLRDLSSLEMEAVNRRISVAELLDALRDVEPARRLNALRDEWDAFRPQLEQACLAAGGVTRDTLIEQLVELGRLNRAFMQLLNEHVLATLTD